MTVPNLVLPLLTALVSFVFAALLLRQWSGRRRGFHLAWAAGLVCYGLGATPEFIGAAAGWNDALYRVWYLFGALLVAAYLGAGTVYLLARTGFGYAVAFSVFVGGLFAFLSQLKLLQEGRPTAWLHVYTVVAVSAVVAVAIAYATARHRAAAPHVALAALAGASLLAAVLVATAVVPAPGYALDPRTQVPVGTAMPGHLRVMTGPLNIAGGFCLVFGALYSFYVYMPKRKLLPARLGPLAVAVNLVASLPRAVAALARGRLNSRVPATLLIALGGFIPGLTSGLDRYGVTWSLYLGELLGVVLILLGFLVSEEVFRRARAPAPANPVTRTAERPAR